MSQQELGVARTGWECAENGENVELLNSEDVIADCVILDIIDRDLHQVSAWRLR